MIIISYDIADDKLRAKFSKYITRFGYRLQYSVYMIENGPRTLSAIISDLESIWEKKFSETGVRTFFWTYLGAKAYSGIASTKSLSSLRISG